MSNREKDVHPAAALSDIVPGDSPTDSLILRLLPHGVRPYALLARWDRPIGTWQIGRAHV